MPSVPLSVVDFPREICLEGTYRRVTVETSRNSLFKGILQRIDLLGNIELIDVKCTAPDSSISIEERVFIKGVNVRLIHFPMELKQSPLLNWRNEKLLLDIRASTERKQKKKDQNKAAPKARKPGKKIIDKKIRKLKR